MEGGIAANIHIIIICSKGMGDFLPILTFPKGRNRLLRILVLAPTYPPPEGEGQIPSVVWLSDYQ